MNQISYGGGVNSSALLIEMYHRRVPIDLITFADTGAEKPETYDYIDRMNQWLFVHGLPQIQIVAYTDKDGDRLTLEEECLRSETLPSLAYGFKRCSLKHKISVQDKLLNNNQQAKKLWTSGEKITKFIGYDAGESRRREKVAAHDASDKKYEKSYALIDWGIDRQGCVDIIRAEGLPVPVKSACFFCPASKKHEISELKKRHPSLYTRAVEIEKLAQSHLRTVKGLGRDWTWEDYIRWEESQVSMFDDFQCEGCYGSYE